MREANRGEAPPVAVGLRGDFIIARKGCPALSRIAHRVLFHREEMMTRSFSVIFAD
jgi:hypothetical protein